MNTDKLNELLSEVIHIACGAELASDEAIKRQALGDIYDALASVLPVEHRAARSVVRALPSDGRACRSATADERTGFAKFLTVGDGVCLTRFAGKDETRLVASRRGRCGNDNTIFEIEVVHATDIARVRRNGKVMFAIFGGTVGHYFIEKMAISALHRYLQTNRQTNEKKKRRRARKAAEKLAAAKAQVEG